MVMVMVMVRGGDVDDVGVAWCEIGVVLIGWEGCLRGESDATRAANAAALKLLPLHRFAPPCAPHPAPLLAAHCYYYQSLTARRLAADAHDARHRLLALLGGHLLELLVAPDHRQHVEQLALVLVYALDLDVEERVDADVGAVRRLDVRREALLVRALDRAPARLQLGVVGVLCEAAQLVRVLDPGVAAERLGDQRGELRVAEREPAARRDAVGLVLELLGEELVEVLWVVVVVVGLLLLDCCCWIVVVGLCCWICVVGLCCCCVGS